MLRVRTKGNGSSAPISKAIRLAFKHHRLSQESGLYRDVRNRAVSLGSGGCQVRVSGVVKDLGLPGSG